MSKKDQKLSDKFDEFMASFIAKMPDEKDRDIWKNSIKNPEIRQQLENNFSMQADYTRKTQELATKRQELESDAQKQYQWWQQANAEFQQVQKDKAVLEEYKQKLANTGINPNTVNPMNPQQTTNEQQILITKINQMQQHINNLDTAAWSTSVGLAKIAKTAAKEGYDYDPEEVLRIASTERIPIESAFEKLTYQEREEKKQKEFERQLEEAREAGRKEAFSKPPDFWEPNANASGFSADRLLKTKESTNPSDPTKARERFERASKTFMEGWDGSSISPRG